MSYKCWVCGMQIRQVCACVGENYPYDGPTAAKKYSKLTHNQSQFTCRYLCECLPKTFFLLKNLQAINEFCFKAASAPRATRHTAKKIGIRVRAPEVTPAPTRKRQARSGIVAYDRTRLSHAPLQRRSALRTYSNATRTQLS